MNTAVPQLDPVTGLLTRDSLFTKIASLFEEHSDKPAVLLLEVHRFKNINDGVGLEIGDQVIRRIAQRIKTAAPADACVGRVGGDGFAVAVPHGNDIQALAEMILDLCRRPIAVHGNIVLVEMSIGVAKSPDDGNNAIDLVHAADIALHNIKCSRFNCIKRFDPSMKDAAQSRMSLENDLRFSMTLAEPELLKALATEQFEIHYQPLAHTENQCIIGLEALMRWNHPERGRVSPEVFIPVAEEIGLMDVLGGWVLNKACKDAAYIRSELANETLTISVNISPKQFDNADYLIKQINRALKESQLPAEALQLEITESTAYKDLEDILADIKSIGCQLALDDFGTGYSSLNLLRTLSFDVAKLDKSFVEQLGNPKEEIANADQIMVKTFEAVCNTLKINSVVEGIETQTQQRFLQEAGIACYQGYLVSKPLPLEQCLDMLRRSPLQGEYERENA